MRLSDEQYECIKQAVLDMFITYDIKCVPISAFEIAIKMGLTVIPYSALEDEKKSVALRISKDGYSVETNGGEWIIFYNDECKSYGRINQTIMHEIAHYFLEHIREGEEEEAEAKFFAKYALAPPPLIHRMIENVNAEAIMQTFDLSYEAACNAYKYYCKWLRFGNEDYTLYEICMIQLFEVA